MSLRKYNIGDILHFTIGKEPKFVIVFGNDDWRWLNEYGNKSIIHSTDGFMMLVERYNPKVVGNIDNFISRIKERIK